MAQAENTYTAELSGSGTGEPKPVFSLLVASLAQTVMLLACFWVIAVLFGAGHLLQQVPAAAVLAAAAGCFAASHLLLRNRRPLLFLLAADVLLAAGAALTLRKIFGLEGAAGGWLTAITIFLAAGILLGLLCQLKWESGRFSDTVMTVQLQALFVIGMMQLWIADQMQCGRRWIVMTFLMAAGLLAGLVAAKVSGLRSGSGHGLLTRSAPVAAALAFCGLVIGGAAAFAEPVGRAVSQAYNLAEGVLAAFMTLVAKVLSFLFMRNRVRLDQGASTADGTGTGDMEFVPTENGNGEFFRTLFHIVCIIAFIMIAVAAIRLLLQVTVGTSISLVRKRHSRVEQDGTLWERFQAFCKELQQRIHARKILRQHPSSVAAMIVWLEDRCSRSEELRRKPGETLRVFLLRLADWISGQNEAGGLHSPAENEPASRSEEDSCCEERTLAANALRNLADAADRACYSRQGDLLAEFAESGIIRAFFSKKP